MARQLSIGLSLFGLVLFTSSPASANDWYPGEVKMNIALDFWIKVYNRSEIAMRGMGPWYTYFPGDDGLMVPPQCNTFPTWPSSFPPPQPQPAKNKVPVMGSIPNYPANPAGLPTGQMVGSGRAPVYQPASYYPTSVPSYWFAR